MTKPFLEYQPEKPSPLTLGWSAAIGAVLVLVGLLVPSSMLIQFLRELPKDGVVREQLLLGAKLFKVGFVILGSLIVTLGRLSLWKSAFPGEKPISNAPDTFNLVILTVILVAATGLRLYGLNAGLWLDEILTYVRYVQMPVGEIISTYSDQNQHFLYSLLAHVSCQVFGESTWAFRLPAVLFGVGSIWALYLFGRQVSPEREALLSAAFLAFSYHHIWFSQNARGYSGLLFWTLLASWLFLRGLREAQQQVWLLYAVAVAFGVYTHITMLFVVVSHFLIYVWDLMARRTQRSPQRWAGFFFGFCVAGLLTFQLHALVLPQVLGGVVGEESTVPAWTNPLWTLLEFVKAVKIGFAGSVIATAALLVFGAGILNFARTHPVVIQLLLIPALIGSAVVVGMGHHLWPRFYFFTFGFGVLIVVRGTMVVAQITTRLLKLATSKSVPLGTAFCAGLILVSALAIPRAYAPKQDFEGALNFVDAKKEPGDAVVTVGLVTFTYKNLYKRDWEQVKTVAALNEIRAHAKRTWLLYTFPPEVASVYPEIMVSIGRDFKVVKEFYGTVGSGTIFVCRSDISSSGASTASVAPSYVGH